MSFTAAAMAGRDPIQVAIAVHLVNMRMLRGEPSPHAVAIENEAAPAGGVA